VDSQEAVPRENGVMEETVLAPVRVASVMHAVGVVLDTQAVAAAEPVLA
jgi:alkyl hydroperoxide reductase subunit D